MLCEICKKNQATFFYKQTKNGITIEKHLCQSCAKAEGLSTNYGLFDFDGISSDDFFGGLFGSFAAGQPKIVAAQKCEKCGTTLGELLHSGRVGCADCYSIFRKSLIPTITKIHGNVAHCGKSPLSALAEEKTEEKAIPEVTKPEKELSDAEKIEELKSMLKKAIDEQEYEMAAQYRDSIKELERKLSEGGEKA